MKRGIQLITAITDPNNMRLAYWKAGKGKRYSHQVKVFQKDLDKNLLTLRGEIQRGDIFIGNYHYFKIYDPKEREICAAPFREQVFHHALMNICHPYFERVQIYDSYASRIGKGTHAAIARAQEYSRQYDYYLKLDVQKFFASLHHSVLREQVKRIIKDKYVLNLFKTLIDSYSASPERGVPIGNLTSQYLANHYLSGLDHFIKETLQIKGYVRYMDDMVLWHDSKNHLKEARDTIQHYLETQLYCTLKPEQLNKTRRGLSFLGYQVFPYQIRLTQRSKLRFMKKMGIIETQYYLGNWTETMCQVYVRPIFSFIRKANTQQKKVCLYKKKGQFS